MVFVCRSLVVGYAKAREYALFALSCPCPASLPLFCTCCIAYLLSYTPSVSKVARHPVASSHVAATSSYAFVTFAFTAEAGGRWNASTCKTGLRLMYSSLVRSQSEYPELHLYSNDPGVIPLLTTMETVPHIILHKRQTNSFPRNEYLIRQMESFISWLDA